MIVSIDDMKSVTQEWFGQCDTRQDVARVYAAVLMETERQMDFMMKQELED